MAQPTTMRENRSSTTERRQPAFGARDRSDSGDPRGGGPIRVNVPIEPVGRNVSRRIAARGLGLARPVGPGAHAQGSHEAHHPFAPTVPSPISQGHVQPWTARDLTIFEEQALDVGGKPGIFSAFAD